MIICLIYSIGIAIMEDFGPHPLCPTAFTPSPIIDIPYRRTVASEISQDFYRLPCFLQKPVNYYMPIFVTKAVAPLCLQ